MLSNIKKQCELYNFIYSVRSLTKTSNVETIAAYLTILLQISGDCSSITSCVSEADWDKTITDYYNNFLFEIIVTNKLFDEDNSLKIKSMEEKLRDLYKIVRANKNKIVIDDILEMPNITDKIKEAFLKLKENI